jgi:inner membrane protein involved in colicin E2 resistance
VIRRIIACSFIFVCTAIAWMILGATLSDRTQEVAPASGQRVQSSWGGPQRQLPPKASWSNDVTKSVSTIIDGKPQTHEETRHSEGMLPLEQTRAHVNVALDYRQKGLLWFSTYTSDFKGEYVFRNDSAEPLVTRFTLPFPSERAVYENVAVSIDGKAVSPELSGNAIVATAAVPPQAVVTLAASYRSRGTENWAYDFGEHVSQLRDFELKVNTNFKNIDFAEDSLSPTQKTETPSGWELTWKYANLVSGFSINLRMPEKIQPGPLAGRISYFAPVSLFFFFFLIFVITTMRGIPLHPVNYFFLATAFFAFHLLLAYLVDHISIHIAMIICSVVSVFLVVSYLRVVVGPMFAFREAALGQVVYLVLFSYAFFWQGFTGLSITVVAIVTLFVVMQATARVNWTEKFHNSAPSLAR